MDANRGYTLLNSEYDFSSLTQEKTLEMAKVFYYVIAPLLTIDGEKGRKELNTLATRICDSLSIENVDYFINQINTENIENQARKKQHGTNSISA